MLHSAEEDNLFPFAFEITSWLPVLHNLHQIKRLCMHACIHKMHTYIPGGGGGGGGGTGPNFDGGVPLLNAKTHPCLRERKGPDKPHV